MWLYFFLAAAALLFLGLFGHPRARLWIAAVPPPPPKPDYDVKETFRVSKLPPSTLRADIPDILSRCFGVDASTVVTRSLSRELPDLTSSPLTATITFTAKPAFFLSRGIFIGVESSRGLSKLSAQYHCEGDGRDYHIAIDQHFLGFTSMTPLEHQTRPGRENIDCIILHGFGGNAMAAFRDPKSEFLWIRDQLPQEFTDLDVVTYGYDCHFNDARSTSDHHDWANVLRHDLYDYRSQNKANDNKKPLIFVVHSLGGFVFKEVIISLSKSERLDEQKIVMCTHGALFFGVPSQGMNTKSLEAVTKTNSATNWTVAQLNQNIGDLLRKKRDEDFTKAYPYSESKIFQFYETKTTFVGKDAAGNDKCLLLVLPQSTIGRPWENNDSYRMNIEGDHREIVKFERDSGQFRKVAGVLRGILKDAGKVVRTRLMHAELGHSIPEGDRRNVLNWLLGKADLDPSTLYRDALGKLEADTAKWLLRCDEWGEWSSANSVFRLLWVHGIPGAGKTVLTSFAIRHLESQHQAENNSESIAAPVGISYYYCSHRRTQGNDVESFLSWVVSNLCFQRDAYVPKLVHRGYSKSSRLTVPELAESLRDVCRRFCLVFVVIDGLDESNSREQFLRTIRNLVLDDSGIKNLRLLVASRDEVDIHGEFNRLGSASTQISMANKHVDEDIRRFICNTIQSNHSFTGRCGPSLCRRVETKLVGGAQGMFRWAWCQLDEITKCQTEGNIQDALERLPKTLDDTYERIIDKIPEPTMEITRQVLKLLCSDEPLHFQTAEALLEAIDWSFRDSEKKPSRLLDGVASLESICGSLIAVEKECTEHAGWDGARELGRGIRLAHYTVKEFLTDDRTKDKARFFHVDKRQRASAHCKAIVRSLLTWGKHQNELGRISARHFDTCGIYLSRLLRHYQFKEPPDDNLDRGTFELVDSSSGIHTLANLWRGSLTSAQHRRVLPPALLKNKGPAGTAAILLALGTPVLAKRFLRNLHPDDRKTAFSAEISFDIFDDCRLFDIAIALLCELALPSEFQGKFVQQLKELYEDGARPGARAGFFITNNGRNWGFSPVRIALGFGINPNPPGVPHTPLQRAVYHGQWEFARLLVEAGASTTAIGDPDAKESIWMRDGYANVAKRDAAKRPLELSTAVPWWLGKDSRWWPKGEEFDFLRKHGFFYGEKDGREAGGNENERWTSEREGR